MTGVTLDDLLEIDRATTEEEVGAVPEDLSEDDEASWAAVEAEHDAKADPRLKRKKRRGEGFTDVIARGLNDVVCKTPGVSDRILGWGQRRSVAILA
ncbi:MAG: hypothetical protein AAGJ96_09300 [Pseudomonadota bacterium]